MPATNHVTALPTPAPNRGMDSATFTTAANNMVAALGPMVTEINDVTDEVNDNADSAASNATVALAASTDASNFATNAANSAATALNAPGTQATSTTSMTIGTGSKSFTLAQTGKAFAINQFVVITNSSTNWMAGNTTAFTSGTGAITVDVLQASGSGTLASWTVTPSAPNTLPAPAGNDGKVVSSNGSAYVFGNAGLVPYTTRTSNTQLVKADKGTRFNITANTFTQTFDTAPNLGNGWHCWLGNSGSGDITIPSSDGVSNWIMYPGEVRFFQSDGTNIQSYVISGFYKTFTSTASFIRPPGYRSFGLKLWGGGNSGKRGSSGLQAQGGGGGGCTGNLSVLSSMIAASETVTIAAGGTAQTIANTDGNPGGTTSFGSWYSISNSGITFSSGGSFVNTNNTIVLAWEAGNFNTNASNTRPLFGGGSSLASNTDPARNSLHGGAAGGFVDSGGTLFSPGTSIHAGNGGAASSAGNGSPGVAPAGGGGGTQTGTQSGAGARGQADVWGQV